MKDRGFTLIEVVVAMAVLGVALTVVISLFGGSLRTAALTTRYTEAVRLASVKMDEAICCAGGIGEDRSEGTVGAVTWTREAEPLYIEDEPLPGLLRVTVTVAWPDSERTREITLESVIYRAQEQGPGGA